MAYAYLPKDKNNDSNYTEIVQSYWKEPEDTPELRRGRQLKLYLEDELARVGEMQLRIVKELMSNSDYFKPKIEWGRTLDDHELIMGINKDLHQAEMKMARLYMHACLTMVDQKKQGRDETDRKSTSYPSI